MRAGIASRYPSLVTTHRTLARHALAVRLTPLAVVALASLRRAARAGATCRRAGATRTDVDPLHAVAVLVGVPLLLFAGDHGCSSTSRRWSAASGSRRAARPSRTSGSAARASGTAELAGRPTPTTRKDRWRQWPLVSSLPRERQQIDKAIRAAEQVSRFEFSVFVGAAEGRPAAYATRLHASLVAPARSILIMVDPAAGCSRSSPAPTSAATSPTARSSCRRCRCSRRSPTGDLVGGLERGIHDARRARPRAAHPARRRLSSPSADATGLRTRRRAVIVDRAALRQPWASLGLGGEGAGDVGPALVDVARARRVGGVGARQPRVDLVEQLLARPAAAGRCTPARSRPVGAEAAPTMVSAAARYCSTYGASTSSWPCCWKASTTLRCGLVGDVVARPSPLPRLGLGLGGRAGGAGGGGVLLAGDRVVPLELGVDPVGVRRGRPRPAR